VYLGPCRTFDDDDLQYLNGDIPEEDEVKLDSYRKELPISIKLVCAQMHTEKRIKGTLTRKKFFK
jgi:hypothetical protein